MSIRWSWRSWGSRSLMIYLTLLFSIMPAWLIPVRSAAAPPPPVSFSLSQEGLASLRFGDDEMLGDGKFLVTRVIAETWDGRVEPLEVNQPHISQTGDQLTLSYPWGDVRRQYKSTPSIPARLDLTITVENHSDAIIREIDIQALTLRLPAKPAEYDNVTPMMASNIGDPSIIPLHYGAGSLALCNEDVGRPLMIGFPWALDRPTSRDYPVWVYTGRHDSMPDSLPYIDRPIFPGQSDHYSLSIRFGGANTTLKTLAGDLQQRFAAAYPFLLHWPDRRPIGELFISTAAAGWPKNPRGWLQDSTIDVTTPEGRKAFDEKLLNYARTSVKILKQMNAQGMITWDPEGQEYPHATSYLGDPRSLPPEIEPIIDDYFRVFSAAGLRVGICVRPQLPVRAVYGTKVWQQDVADPAANLIAKIAYARKRWGCTLFYVDSNGDPNRPMDAAIFRRVAAAFPDALLMPEHKNTLYHAYTAPYNELRQGFTGTRPSVSDVYPGAFDVISVPDGPIEKRHDELVAAVRRGDILLFRAWFADTYNDQVRRIYQDEKPPRSAPP
ncbi:MAG TPA: hypothetical protein VFJ58_09490 [Armatimonadota bacterium]|nr:hypothetical protein [Armatimonadota bacterium]